MATNNQHPTPQPSQQPGRVEKGANLPPPTRPAPPMPTIKPPRQS